MNTNQASPAAGEVLPSFSRAAFFVLVLNFHLPDLSAAFSSLQAMLANCYVNFLSLCVKPNSVQTESNLRMEEQKIYCATVCIVVALK